MTPGQRLRQNVSETFLALASGSPDANIVKTPKYWMCTSGFEHPIGNFAIHLDLDPADFDALASVAKSRPSFRIYALPGDSPQEADLEFGQRGLREVYRLCAMESDSMSRKAEDVAKIATGRSLERTIRFVIDTFFWSSGQSVRHKLHEVVLRSDQAGHEYYFVEGARRVIGAATLVYSEGCAGLYNVCVHPAERGRGLGAKIVAQLAAVAAEKHLPLVLQCDFGLTTWYKYLGFHEIGETRVLGFSAKR